MWECKECGHQNETGLQQCGFCGKFRSRMAKLKSRGAMQGTIVCAINGHTKGSEVTTRKGYTFDICGVCGASFNMRKPEEVLIRR